MKIVLDTNVFISGVFWKGTPRKILETWVQGKITLCLTESIYLEYLRVLHEIDDNGLLSFEWIDFVTQHAVIYDDLNSASLLCRDPDDQKFLDCAFTAKVNFLVSGDKDLLVLEHVHQIPILSPADFITILSKS